MFGTTSANGKQLRFKVLVPGSRALQFQSSVMTKWAKMCVRQMSRTLAVVGLLSKESYG
jgi:hypothetical protein